MTRVADEVLGKLARQQSDVFRRVREGSLSPEKAFRLHKQLLGNLLVRVNAGRGWIAMVDGGGYDGKYINSEFTEADLPPFPANQAEAEINLHQQDDTTTTQRWFDILDGNEDGREKFAHPLSVLAIGEDKNTKDEQREAPIFTIWESPRSGRLWCLILSGGGDGRDLDVYRGSPDGRWGAGYRAAAVAK